MVDLLIFGTNEIAREAFHCFNMDISFRVVAFTVDSKFMVCNSMFGIPIIPAEEIRNSYSPASTKIFVGISYGRMNQNRANTYDRLREWGYSFASYIDPKAAIYTQDIGENVFIQGNVSIQSSVSIGNNVIIGPNVVIGHDTQIKDHNYIASSACFCGGNTIDENCVIGSSAVIGPRVNIGKSNFIGIGANIFKSTGDNEAYLTGATPKSKMPADRAWMIGLLK